MTEDQGGKARTQRNDAPWADPPAQTLDAQQYQRVDRHSRELGEGIAAYIDVGEMIGRKGVGSGSGQGRQGRGRQAPRQRIGPDAGQQKAEGLGGLDAQHQVAASPVEQRCDIVGERAVKIIKGIAEAIGAIRQPAGQEHARSQIGGELLDPDQEKGRVATSPREHHARPQE